MSPGAGKRGAIGGDVIAVNAGDGVGPGAAPAMAPAPITIQVYGAPVKMRPPLRAKSRASLRTERRKQAAAARSRMNYEGKTMMLTLGLLFLCCRRCRINP